MKTTVMACGRCKVPLKGSATLQPVFTLACPICGESDTFANVRREVDEYRQEQSMRMLGDTLTLQPDHRFIAIESK
jgi:hypothetical protein